MALAACDTLGGQLAGGLVAAPIACDLPPPVAMITAEHPEPGLGSEEAGRRALGLAAAVRGGERLLVLLSGGASSLLAAPAEGVSLAEKRDTTRALMRAGSDIHALNTVRKHVSAIKGGRLAAACGGECLALVLSDVVGDDPGVIASGPTVADSSTYADALGVLRRFGGVHAYPAAVTAHIEAGAAGAREESIKPGDPRLSRTKTVVVGSRHTAMQGAALEASRRGYAVVVLSEPLTGEARMAGAELVRRAIDRTVPSSRPVCVVSSGETTVRVVGRGRGGRNQELALAAALALAERRVPAVLASVGTDGIDGPTDAAGALVDSQTSDRMGRAAIEASLADNDAYTLLGSTGDLVRWGPTGTNVGDLQIFLLA